MGGLEGVGRGGRGGDGWGGEMMDEGGWLGGTEDGGNGDTCCRCCVENWTSWLWLSGGG